MTRTSETQEARKLYIVTLKHGTWQKRLFLDGPAGSAGEEKFSALRADVAKLGDTTSDKQEFKDRVLKLFATNDFHCADS
jgi:hypothetical protein